MKTFLKTTLLFIILLCSLFIEERNYKNMDSADTELRSSIVNSSFPFIANAGQVDDRVKYYARTFGSTVFVTESGEIVYSFLKPENEYIKYSKSKQKKCSYRETTGLALKEMIINGEMGKVIGKGETQAKANYFKGADSSAWKTDITAFETIDFGEVYKGIDFKLKAYGNNIEKLFTVNPGAEPGAIRIKIEGADDLKVKDSGKLEVETQIGTISFTKPVAFQDYDGTRKYVQVEYVSNSNEYSFKVGDYNPEKVLVIDPMLSSTFLGGSDIDDMYEPTIVLDNDGNVFISGFTSSHDFPTTVGVFNAEFNGGSKDRFISKFNNNLSKLLASTFIGGKGLGAGFIGGNGDELGHALAVDKNGNVYIAGYTESPDYPVTSGSFDESYNGGRDLYVSKLNSNLNTLMASTFIGGSGDEGYQWPRIDLALSENGDVYIAGITHSVDFPVSDNAFDQTFNGGLHSGDAFAVKLEQNLTKILASTYLGGNGNEWRVSVMLDKDKNIFICGESTSSNFPTTSNAYDKTSNVNENGVIKDIFISKLSSDLSVLSASTLFGGINLDEALDMKISDSGDIYITGYTESTDFPTTPEAYNREWSGGNRDAYIARFDNSLSKLISSTLFGGSMIEMSRGLILDNNGDVYLTGSTSSPDFPVTPGAFSLNFRNGSADQRDAFIAKFNADLSRLLISACFGGSSRDIAFCIEIDKNGDIFVSGLTASENFPTAEGAYDNSSNGGIDDCFIAKFDSELSEK